MRNIADGGFSSAVRRLRSSASGCQPTRPDCGNVRSFGQPLRLLRRHLPDKRGDTLHPIRFALQWGQVLLLLKKSKRLTDKQVCQFFCLYRISVFLLLLCMFASCALLATTFTASCGTVLKFRLRVFRSAPLLFLAKPKTPPPR